MTWEIRVPKLPESVADATLVAWRKRPGEAVSRDENLADLETDKVVLEVPAPASGVLQEIKVEAGATVRSDDLLAIIAPAAASSATSAAPQAVPSTAGAGKHGPAVRRLLAEQPIDAASIAGSGRDGRLTKADVLEHMARGGAAPVPSPPAPVAPATPVETRAPLVARAERRVPMTRLRQRIAERLVQAQRTAAMLTTFNEVDLSAVNELRAKHKERFEKEHGVKLGFMSFFVKAAIEGLKKFPVMNAAVDGNDIVYHEYYDIGVAVSTDRGLVVPVVRDAAGKSFADLEREIADYATRARSNALTIEELTGGTFTITNGGVFGSLLSTPILNAPQSAILGMHKIQERPVAVGGQVAVRPMMYLAVSYDHRIIDGREAVQFLVAIKDCLEDPARMLLGI
ncbi:MAG: 2-oxoglutarate dehydrogenase complex dihydrolipoyllysine-residue succinyltransferase [Steroidobacteraceae bacterium]|nr:2-oxoglutarate dehydrogenase complex dihydrolipoyllysine-residue succinyltransferase [Steroidobacteraceae bacterium]MDW8259937.1 2-oxoglutarate dehydrogenase complex dihydrolipoyllysine-residue succinyltransferase [Gammaproteobacteria bacterium]